MVTELVPSRVKNAPFQAIQGNNFGIAKSLNSSMMEFKYTNILAKKQLW